MEGHKCSMFLQKQFLCISVDTNIINFIANILGVNRPLGWDNYVTQPQQQKSHCTVRMV